MLKRAIVSLSLLAAAAGCDGGGTSVSDPAHDAMCAMNPLAVSCGPGSAEEVAQGAVFGPPAFTSDWTAWWGNYECDVGSGNFTAIGGRTHTYNGGGGFADWHTRYEVTNRGNQFGFVDTLSVAPLIQLTMAMDGPYHVLYNAGPNPYTENVCITNPSHPACILAAIPQYGTWIYAPNERPDFPGGVQIITIDPQHPDPLNGACATRKQFVVPL